MARTEQQPVEVGVSGTRHDPLGRLPAFERACLAVAAERLSDPQESAKLLAVWFDGVSLLDDLSQGRADAGRPGHGDGVAEPRVFAAMTHLATAWLSLRFAGEPRNLVFGRIAALRPVGQNARQVELCEKNSEHGLTSDERGELDRLMEFFDALQTILNSAIRSLPPRTS